MAGHARQRPVHARRQTQPKQHAQQEGMADLAHTSCPFTLSITDIFRQIMQVQHLGECTGHLQCKLCFSDKVCQFAVESSA